MQTHVLLVQLGLVLAAGFVGGAIARALRLPVLVGFLVAGLAVGPHTPGPIASRDVVANVANLGVVLLMFTVGLQFSFHELIEVRTAAVWGGCAQIAGTAALGMFVAKLLGWPSAGGIFLGSAIALSSTAVVVRILEERGELGTVHGRIILGILVVQDLAVVLIAVLLPAIGSPSGADAMTVGLALGRAAAFVGVVLLLASRVAPFVLAQVARLRSRELFVLTVVTICVGAALAAEASGVELALGAFLAGLVVAGSDYADEVLSQVRPMRDVFASVFFVSVGMLLDPDFLWSHWLEVTAVVLAIALGKSLIAALSVYVTGRHPRVSLQVGFSLGQIGEFSFVLAGIGVARDVISADAASTVLAAAVVTIMLTPFLHGLGPRVYAYLERVPGLRARLNRMPAVVIRDLASGCEDARAAVLGYGRVGRLVSDGLLARGIPHVVCDMDSAAVRAASSGGLPVIYGDASSDILLSRAVRPCTELVVVALPEAPASEVAVRNIRMLNSLVKVIVRVHRFEEVGRLQSVGADEVVYAESLAGDAMLRSALDHLGPAGYPNSPGPANAMAASAPSSGAQIAP